MSGAADRPRLPPEWERLERAAGEAASVVAYWRRRARESDEEVARLRTALEALADERGPHGDPGEEVRRLRAENASLRSRVQQARRRVDLVLKRLSALEVEP